MDELNCCVVGYGGIALYHVEALKKIKGAVLHTVVGRRPEPTISFKEEHGFLKALSCYEEALSASEIDAIIITSPSELHYKMYLLRLELTVVSYPTAAGFGVFTATWSKRFS